MQSLFALSALAAALAAPSVSTEPAPNPDAGGSLDVDHIPQVSQDEISRFLAAARSSQEGGWCGPFMRHRSKKHRQGCGGQAKTSARKHRKTHPKARRGVRNGR